LSQEAQDSGKIRQLSVSGLLAESIRRINSSQSLSSMFVD